MSICQTQNVRILNIKVDCLGLSAIQQVRFHIATNSTLPTSPSITVAVNNSKNERPSLEPMFGLSVLIYCRNTTVHDGRLPGWQRTILRLQKRYATQFQGYTLIRIIMTKFYVCQKIILNSTHWPFKTQLLLYCNISWHQGSISKVIKLDKD